MLARVALATTTLATFCLAGCPNAPVGSLDGGQVTECPHLDVPVNDFESFCGLFEATFYCRYARCWGADMDAVRRAWTPEPHGVCDRRTLEQVNRGALRYVPHRGRACLSFLSSAECADVEWRDSYEPWRWMAACLAVIEGTKPPGASCGDGQCAPGGLCDTYPASLGGRCTNVCRKIEVLGLGTPCDPFAPFERCESQAECAGDANGMTCRATTAFGQRCSDLSWCGAFGECRGGICVEYPDEGEACSNGRCRSSTLFCNSFGRCQHVGTETSTCALGWSCHPLADCVEQPTGELRCVHYPGVGETCPGGFCGEGWCDRRSRPPTCRLSSLLGDACDEILENCERGTMCENGTCIPASICQ